MPRSARLLVPHIPHHVIQRGHNRSNVFLDDEDFRHYLDVLVEWKCKLDIRLYAFCLMTNHVHLILQPGAETASIGQLMRRLAGRSTRRFNARRGRTGTLWSGRYKASPIDTDAYLLACTRYVELNPVRAGIVRLPDDYSWSSYCLRSSGTWPQWLDMDPCYAALGDDATIRIQRYRQFVIAGIEQADQSLIRDAVSRNQLTGDEAFIRDIAKRINRRIEARGPGRPASRASGK